MSHRESRLTLDRRALLGGAILGGVGAALGAQPASAAPRVVRSASRPPRSEIVWPPPSSQPLALRLLDTPVRVYDSRVGQAPEGTDSNTGAGDTRLAKDSTRRIDVSFVLGSAASPTGVDSTSAGVLMNLTAVNTIGASGFLKVWAYSATEPTVSSLNWDHQSAVIANSVTSRHFEGWISIKCGGPDGCSTNIIVDVLGYYELMEPSPPI